MALPKGVSTRVLSVRMILKLSSLSCVVAICANADCGSCCLRSVAGYEDAEGTLVVAPGSGLVSAAAVRSCGWDQFESWRACSAFAIVWAWLADGMRCGATTMLRCLSVLEGDRQALGEELLHGERGAAGRRHVALEGRGQPRVRDDRRGAAADGAGRGGRVRQVAGLLQAVAAGDHLVGARRGGDLTIDGSTAPSTGQAKSVLGVTWRIVSTVVGGNVGGALEMAQGAGDVLAVVGDGGEVGVAEREGDDLLALDRVLEFGEPLLGDRLTRAGRAGVAGALDAVARRSSRRRRPAGRGRSPR